MTKKTDWEAAKERIRDRVDFVGLVEEYVSLEERGKGYWGLCPFHTEDTPSFSVTPSMGIFKCFGCGEGGDLFDFYMKIENCNFSEAMKRLADRTNVELPQTSESNDTTSGHTSDLREITNYAMERYEEAFWSAVGERARNYMRNRGYTEDLLEEFNIGFAPEGWRNLTKALKRDGYDLEKAKEAGLVRTSDDGRVYDAFRNRILFPIHDRSGDVVAFGGRILESEDDNVPKYLNSTDSPIFHKRQTLYGFTKARETIRDTGRCLLMEGYTDVMMCHQVGYDSAVATLGTALTEQHIQNIKRNTDEIVFIYDGDESGRQAIRDGGEIALENNLNVSVVLMPPDKDPADLLQHNKTEFERHLDSKKSYINFLFDWMENKYTLDNAENKEKILREFYPVLRSISSDIKRDEKIGWLSDKLKLDEKVVRSFLKRVYKKETGSSRTSRSSGEQETEQKLKNQSGELIEEIFFRSLVQNTEKFGEAVEILQPKDFSAKANRDLMRALKEIESEDLSFSGENWIELVDESRKSYVAGILSWNEISRIAEGTDPVEVASKIKNMDAAKRESDELMQELAQQDERQGAGELDESKKILLEEVMNLKSKGN